MITWSKKEAGVYVGSNGWTIKRTHWTNIWTHKEMADQRWEVFDENHKRVSYSYGGDICCFTLREAKEEVEKLVK